LYKYARLGRSPTTGKGAKEENVVKVKRAKNVIRFPEHWDVQDEFRPEGRHPLTTGREFSVTGHRGRVRFRHAVTNTRTGDVWIDAWDKDGRARSFRPERIRTVHSRTARLRASSH
jgi:hypothetical protein